MNPLQHHDVVVDVLINGAPRPIRVIICDPGVAPEIRGAITASDWSTIRAGVIEVSLNASTAAIGTFRTVDRRSDNMPATRDP